MEPNTDEVERLVLELMAAIKHFGHFDGADGLSAVLTFAFRFTNSVLTLSPDAAAKKSNVTEACRALRTMAAQLEWEHTAGGGKERVH